MKYTVMSDLHLEFAPLVLPGGDTLLLAGDVCVAEYLREKRTDADARSHKKIVKRFFFDECSKYKRVFYIAGNHEHYHGMFDDTHNILREFLQGSNVQFLQNEAMPLDDNTLLWAATLWTDFNQNDWFAVDAAKRGMNDFYIIHKYGTPISPYGNNYPKLHPLDCSSDNLGSVVALKAALRDNPDKKFVVMTHHTPSFKSCHPRYGDDRLNYAYSNTKLDNWIADTPQITHWLHGHTHDSWDYMINNCRVICNPRGYYKADPNTGFDPEMTFELG